MKSINYSIITPNIKVSKGVTNTSKLLDYKDKECLHIIISNLIACGYGDRVLLYSRETGGRTLKYIWNKKGIINYRIVKCIDWLTNEKMIFNHVSSKYQLLVETKKMSMCYPTSDFINLFCSKQGTIEKSRDEQIKSYPVLILRNEDKEDMEFKQTKEVSDYIAHMQLLNVSNSNFSVLHKGTKLDTEYKRVFNNGSFTYNGRMYSNNIMGIENRVSKDRLRLTIDNSPVAEVDYSALHLRLLVDMNNEELPDSDLYNVMLPIDRQTKENRVIVKLCSVSMLNVSSERAALLSFRNHLDTVKGHTFKTPKEILNCIYSVMGERSISSLYQDHIGLKLCNIESRIMSKVCSSFVELGLPVFPVHDSAIVRQCDYELLACMMSDYYKQELNVNHVIPMQASMFINGELIKEDVSQ